MYLEIILAEVLNPFCFLLKMTKISIKTAERVFTTHIVHFQ